MSLTFSAEARRAANRACRETDGALLRTRQQVLDDALDAALAHDAPMIEREMIAQRVAALTEQQRIDLIGPLMASDEWRAALVHALTEAT